MPSSVNSEFFFDAFKLVLYITCAYLALNIYSRRVQTRWLLALTARRHIVLTLLTLLVVGIKVFEDVISKESGPIDTAVLWFIRENIPRGLTAFFTLITLTGASIFLAPATVVVSGLFFATRNRRQAFLLAVSMICAWVLTYSIKALVNRTRPELWEAAWNWGASFPSGHTMNTAAFATALAISLAQIWPRSRYVAVSFAVLWTCLVAMSRLVLGAHWPTDVLAAFCLGVFVPLSVSAMLDIRQARRLSR